MIISQLCLKDVVQELVGIGVDSMEGVRTIRQDWADIIPRQREMYFGSKTSELSQEQMLPKHLSDACEMEMS